MPRALTLLVALAAASAAQAQTWKPPKAPRVRWSKARARLVRLPDGHPALPASEDIDTNDDARLLFGPTPGFAVSFAANGDLELRSFTPFMRSKATPDRYAASTTLNLGFQHAGARAVKLPVQLIRAQGEDTGWSYRIPMVLQVKASQGTVWLRDGDQDGWFDELGADRVAVGTDPKALEWAAFEGYVELKGKRYLLHVGGTSAAQLWPVGDAVPLPTLRCVGRINDMRRVAGLPPVGLAEELREACQAHARYCAKHGPTRAQQASSDGHTPEGAYVASRGHAVAAEDAGAAGARLVRALWARNDLLSPGVDRVGVGFAEGWCVVDVATHGDPRKRARRPVFWPPDGARDVPGIHAGDHPSPLPGDATGRGAFVSILLPRGSRDGLKSSRITPRPDGLPVAHLFVDPLRPAPAAAKLYPINDSCIAMIPNEELAAFSIFEVECETTGGKRYRWTFHIGSQR